MRLCSSLKWLCSKICLYSVWYCKITITNKGIGHMRSIVFSLVNMMLCLVSVPPLKSLYVPFEYSYFVLLLNIRRLAFTAFSSVPFAFVDI